MKKAATILVLAAWSLAAQAQSICNSGARIVSQNGTYWVVDGGNFTLKSESADYAASLNNLTITGTAGLALTASSLLPLSGNWLNNGTFSPANGSTITLNGSSAQSMGGTGTNTFSNLTLNNTAGVTLGSNITTNGTLDFLNGILTTGTYSATIGVSGSITNAGDSKYINGKLAQTFNAVGSKSFPIGKGGSYRPLTFQYSGLTGTSVVTAEQFESGLTGTLPSNASLLTSGRYWSLSESGGSAPQYFVSLDATGYSPTGTVVILKKSSGGVIESKTTTTPNYTSSALLSDFGDFALGEILCSNPIGGGTITGNQTICSGTTVGSLGSGSLPIGYGGTLENKWQFSTTSSSAGFSDIASSNSASYAPGALSTTTWYKRLSRVDCKADWTGAAVSNVIQVSIDPVTVGGSIAGSGSVCSGSNSTTLSLSGQTGSVVKWQKSTDGWTTTTDVANTTTTLETTNLSVATNYHAIVQSGICPLAISAEARITINPDGQVNQPVNQILFDGSTTAVTFTTANSGGITTYAWTNSTTAIGLAGSGTGDMASFKVVNKGTAPVVATIVVTPIFTNEAGCTGTAKTFTITVKPLIAGDTNGDGKIDGTEIAGDTNRDGRITPPEIAGDTNGDGHIDGTEVTGDKDGNGKIDGTEVFGDTNGDGTKDVNIITGDTNGDGKIGGTEIAGDTNGDGRITAPEIAGDINGDGKITAPEIVGDTNGDGQIDGTEVTGDKDGDGKIDGEEVLGDTNGDGTKDVKSIPGDTNGDGKIDGKEITGDNNGDGRINISEIAGDSNGDGKISSSEITGDTNGDGKIDGTEIAGDTNGDGKISFPEIAGDTNGNGKIDGAEVAGDPAVLFAMVSNRIICNGSFILPVIFSVGNTGGITTYAWTNDKPSIGLKASGTGNISSFAALNAGILPVVATIQVVPTFTTGGVIRIGQAISFTITVNPLPVPTISGLNITCAGGNSVSYAAEPGMTDYTWSVSSGGTITSGGSTNVGNVKWNGAGPQIVMVNYAGKNGCRAAAPSQYQILVNSLPVPSINGPTTVCEGTTGSIYSTEPFMTEYTWNVSSGGRITSDAAATSIAVVWDTPGTKTVSVNYKNRNGCMAVNAAVKNVTVNPVPVPTISGAATACTGATGVVYSTEPGMTQYNWNISYGGSITSGMGTSSITVKWNAAGAQNVGVNYTSTGACNSGLSTIKQVMINPQSGTAGAITGPTVVCGGSQGVVYSIMPVANVTGYVWSVPAGSTIVSGAGTLSITVNYVANSTSGVISVYGINPCGNSNISTMPVNVTPLVTAPGNISGTSSVCQSSTGLIFTVSPVANATGYTWSIPAGATIVSGASSNSIVMDLSKSAVSGLITVSASNGCGKGANSPVFNLTVNAIPSTPAIIPSGTNVVSSATEGNQWYYTAAANGIGAAVSGGTGITFTPAADGLYWTQVTSNGCLSAISNKLYRLKPGEPTLFNIYPVPNQGEFTVSIITPEERIFSVLIYNQIGQKVYEISNLVINGSFRQLINLLPASSGIYTITFRNKDGNVIKKFTINK